MTKNEEKKINIMDSEIKLKREDLEILTQLAKFREEKKKIDTKKKFSELEKEKIFKDDWKITKQDKMKKDKTVEKLLKDMKI